ncbi:aminopeptidase N, partial [Streptomyces sp. NPDC127574]
DMAVWARSWLQTAGVNSLTPQVVLSSEGRVTELAVLQEAAESHPELRPHRVAVGLYRRESLREGGDGALVRYARAEVDVDGPRTVVADLAGSEAPDLVLVNDDDLTYCKIRFDEGSLAALRDGLGEMTDPLARALCWSA